MVNYRGSGRSGFYTQVRFSLDEDAGTGLHALEDELLQGVFANGYRSDVVRLLLRHWVEHPPDMLWSKQAWMQKLGEGWPRGHSPSGEEPDGPREVSLDQDDPMEVAIHD